MVKSLSEVSFNKTCRITSSLFLNPAWCNRERRPVRVWTLGFCSTFLVLKLVSGTWRCTVDRIRKLAQGWVWLVLYMEERSYLITEILFPFFPEKMQLLHLSIVKLLEGTDSFQSHNDNKDSCRRRVFIFSQHLAYLLKDVGMSTLHESSPHIIFSEGICRGCFWVQKIHLPRGSFSSR